MYQGQRPDIKEVIKLSLSMLHENYRVLPDSNMHVDGGGDKYIPRKLRFNENHEKLAALRRQSYKERNAPRDCDKRILQSVRNLLNPQECDDSATI